MNPLRKKENNEDQVPIDLPHEDISDGTIQIKISKNKLKTGLKIAIIILIIIVSTPRIINNISSTTEVISTEARKFPEFFPSLTLTGITIGSFISSQANKLSSFMSDNLALMVEILYKRKIPNEEILGSKQSEEKAKPIKIIIDKVGINSSILNPETTDIAVLEEALKYGVVRYPKSGILGEDNNLYLFGHSTSIKIVRNEAYKSLNGLKDLQPEDIIKIQSNNREYLYKVFSVTMKKDSDAIVEFKKGKRMLTISTCNTLGAKEDRYIVEADFVTSYSISGSEEIEESNAEQTQNDAELTQKNTKENINNTNNSEDSSAVKNTTPTQTTQQPTHSFVTIPTQTVTPSIPNGKVDLDAEITEVGILDPFTSEFIATTTIKSSDKIAFKFIVSNLGTKKAEGWTFNTVLPTSPLYIFHSNNQETLNPGEKMEYAMGFDKGQIGEDVVIIVNLDPTGSFFEPNENNNIVKKFITIVE